jgi:opacity protein-like surface antigen
MKSVFRYILPVFGLFALGMPAHAQSISSPYRFLDSSQEAGVFVAHISSDEGTLGLNSSSGLAFGARYAIVLSGPFMIEADVMYFPTRHAVLDTLVVDSAFSRIGEADHSLVVATAALRLNLTGQRTWNNLQPFLLFGAGGVAEVSKDKDAVNAAPQDARYDFGTSFAGTVGAGVAFVPTTGVAIRLDATNLLWKVKTPAALLRSNLGRPIPTDEWVQNLTFSAGVSIFF